VTTPQIRKLTVFYDKGLPSLGFMCIRPKTTDFLRPHTTENKMASIPVRAAAQAPHRRSVPPPSRPLPQGVVDHAYRYTLAQRIHCLVLLTEGFSAAIIEKKTGVKKRQQRNIRKKAYKRGFRPDEDSRILKSYIINSARSGRPKEISEDKENALFAVVRGNRSGREKSSEVLIYKQGISCSSALRILRKHRLSCVKPTTKPGLTAVIRKIRYKWALAY
jgi:hypothetical protein